MRKEVELDRVDVKLQKDKLRKRGRGVRRQPSLQNAAVKKGGGLFSCRW